MRALQPKPEGYVERERAPRADRGPRRDNNNLLMLPILKIK